MLRVYHAINDDHLLRVQRHVTDSNHRYQNWCGQTLLHWAVLRCNHDVITWLCKNFPAIIDVSDNVGPGFIANIMVRIYVSCALYV